MNKIKHFLQYNNITIVLLMAVILIGSSVLAAPLAKDALGQKYVKVEGKDNTLLIATDFGKYNIVYKVERIENDENYYYVTYTFNNINLKNNIWVEEIQEKTLKISIKGLTTDLGQYVAEQLDQERVARLDELNKAQILARTNGPEKRMQVVAYSGLIGKALDVRKAIFKDYEPVTKKELPTPNPEPLMTEQKGDSLKAVYDQFIATHPELQIDPKTPSIASITPDTVAITSASSTTEIEPPNNTITATTTNIQP